MFLIFITIFIFFKGGGGVGGVSLEQGRIDDASPTNVSPSKALGILRLFCDASGEGFVPEQCVPAHGTDAPLRDAPLLRRYDARSAPIVAPCSVPAAPCPHGAPFLSSHLAIFDVISRVKSSETCRPRNVLNKVRNIPGTFYWNIWVGDGLSLHSCPSRPVSKKENRLWRMLKIEWSPFLGYRAGRLIRTLASYAPTRS